MTLDDKTLKYIEHYKAIKEKKKACLKGCLND